MKGQALNMLRDLAFQDSYERHPTLPDYARTIHPYNPKTANGLIRCILDFLRFSGFKAERISKADAGSRRRISGMNPAGTADISATIHDVSVKIEILSRDKLSPAQIRYRDQVVKAGGQYWAIGDLDLFFSYLNRLILSKCNSK